ncbi:recombination-associated protein RdgC [Orbaceae bacterium ESL0727]|nr:recombination-associated protein RdgC [Orbaceae bacterium ESL0727]
MLWFKNAIIYQLSDNHSLDKESIENAVKAATFIPCGSLDNSKMGWVSPYSNNAQHHNQEDNLILEMQGQFLLKMKKETKILPSSVLKQALLDKIAKQEQALSRRLTKTEKASLKDEVMVDLIPRAFSKYTSYWLWLDPQNKRVIIDCGSFKQAEDILAILRKPLGTLALTPLSIDKPLEKIMTTWVSEKRHFPPLQLGDEAELKDPLEGNGIIRCKNQDVTSDEIETHINAGKWVTKLKIIDDRGVSFIVNADLTFKRIKFDAVILDENEDIGTDELDKRLEADFLIMSTTLANTINTFSTLISKES